MKKILLILVVLSVKATAQQKDLFDIDKHVQKNLQEKRNAAETDKLLYSYGKKHSVTGNYYLNNLSDIFTLSNGDKVVILPFDNMPCIVPDMRQFQAMPNPGRNILAYNFNILPKRLPGAIPNGAPPFGIIVDVKPAY